MNRNKSMISTNLWFDTNAEDAVNFYTSIFKNSRIGKVIRYGKERHELPGLTEESIMTIEFELDGYSFVALNGGPQFTFTEAISFIVHCETQEEIDYYWDKLSEGGDEKAQACGWLKDKFGVSWQIIPDNLADMLNDPDTERSARVMKALLRMSKKLDMKTLVQVFEDTND